ncbi:MAG: glycerol-3-phosphate 1-O-acyltransferase PlsY [Oscillospiraceae bacterium]|nr:glycerol-3-phosphate 1-O-acyltransferase PlsY [Oscillospiraceae bacterium]
MVYLVVILIAYCLGSISFSVILGKKLAGVDVRSEGSKSAGTTNVLRIVGKQAAAITLICDILKGVVAVLIAVLFVKINTNINGSLLVQYAAVAVILGHTFPVFFGFKGGKGVATALGVILTMNWEIGLICLVFGLLLIILTRMVSVGSLGAAILFPVLVIFLPSHFIVAGSYYIVSAIIIAILVIYNHRANIQRLTAGTENKLSFKKK